MAIIREAMTMMEIIQTGTSRSVVKKLILYILLYFIIV